MVVHITTLTTTVRRLIVSKLCCVLAVRISLIISILLVKVLIFICERVRVLLGEAALVLVKWLILRHRSSSKAGELMVYVLSHIVAWSITEWSKVVHRHATVVFIVRSDLVGGDDALAFETEGVSHGVHSSPDYFFSLC